MKVVWILVFILSISNQAKAEVLIRTVAQVKGHVITSREVEIHKKITEVAGSAFQDLKVKDPEEQLIREWLLFLEASSFYNSGISDRKKNSLLSEIKPKLDSPQWRKLAVTAQELNAKIRRRLEADRLYVFKRKASVLPVTLAEIETEYTQNRVNYGNFEFEEVKEKIRQNKIEENLQTRLQQWFQVLEKKYKVQRFSHHSKKNQAAKK